MLPCVFVLVGLRKKKLSGTLRTAPLAEAQTALKPVHTGDKVEFDTVDIVDFDFVDFRQCCTFVAVLSHFCRKSTVVGSFYFVEQLSNGDLYEYL